MLPTTLAELKAHPTRLLGVVLAVALSVGFVVACLVFVDTQAAALKRSVAVRTAGSSVVVTPTEDRDLTAGICDTPGVEAVERSRTTWLEFSADGRTAGVEVVALPRRPELRWMTLQLGSWPRGGEEIAVGRRTAARAGIGIGGEVVVRTDRGTGSGGSQRLRVVGLVDESASLFADVQSLGVVDTASSLLDGSQPDYLVIARPGVDPDALATALASRLPAETQVKTAAAVAEERLDGLTGGIDVVRYLLLGFGSIAALVGAMIITNLLGIVVAQRRRQLGLLRAVGATRGQLRRALLLEALIAGTTGAALGVVAGAGVATAVAAATGTLGAGPSVAPVALLLAAFGGIVITVLAALAPARSAMTVSPLEALRPVCDPASTRRSSSTRAVLAGALGVLGVGMIAAALLRGGSGTVIIAVAGAALTATAIIGLAPVFLPPVFAVVNQLLSRSRPSVRLAATNTVRHPARTTAVCTALMLGVGLVVTLQVGAASVQRSAEASLRSEFPVDAIVRAPTGQLPAGVITKVRELPDVRSCIEVPSTDGHVGDQALRLDGLGADAGSVVATGLGMLDSRTALAHGSTLQLLGASDGDTITVRVGHRSEHLVLRSSDVADAGSLVVTVQNLHRLDPDAPVGSVWAAARPDADPAVVMSGIRTVAADLPGLEVGGSLEQVAAISTVLDGLLRIATALTGVAVVIALVGMGNSLTLSVIERSRESALLRALGLQRRQLGRMLAAEAVLLALTGAGVGVLAGIGFGMVGAAAMAAEGGFAATRFSVSGPQTIAVVAVAAIAGALASVVPGQRAAKARPVDALAET